MKLHLSKTLKVLIFPELERQGFILDDQISMPGSYWFKRKHNGKEQTFSIGRTKFGRATSFGACKQTADDDYVWVGPKDFGHDKHDYSYSTQVELEEVVQNLVSLFNDKILLWLNEM